MRVFLVLGDRYVDLDRFGILSVQEELIFNPYDLGRGIVGFHLRGDTILPVVDLNARIGLEKTEKSKYVVLRRCVFRIWYSRMTLEKPSGTELNLDDLEREIISELEVNSPGEPG